MSKRAEYQRILLSLPDWDTYLLQESGLPGPRGNLELAAAVADLAGMGSVPVDWIEHWLSFTPDRAPANSPQEFLAFCGTVALGSLAIKRSDLWPRLRALANDPRWRIREAAAMALQRLGGVSMDHLLELAADWTESGCREGRWLELRAVAAALAEPALLRHSMHALAALRLLDRITTAVETASLLAGTSLTGNSLAAFRVLRQGLGYCWSVVIAALPAEGLPMLDRWAASPSPDVRWIVQENRKKARLKQLLSV